jgi:ferritin-like metal-binding protein YciE
MNTLREAFLNELADVYDAEKQLTKALPKMAKASEDHSLRSGFQTHLKETENHVKRLDQVFNAIGEKAKSKKCKAMRGLIEVSEELIDEKAGDAALICAAQKVEHYEIAAYGSLRSWASILDEPQAARLLAQTFYEEKDTDQKLNDIAEIVISLDESEEEEHAPKPVGRQLRQSGSHQGVASTP